MSKGCLKSVLKSMEKKDKTVKIKEVSHGKKLAMPRK
jgi:hypothetical protein